MTLVDRIAEPWGTRTPYGAGEEWPVRQDSFLEPGLTSEQVERWVQTASLLHSNGDAMDIAEVLVRALRPPGTPTSSSSLQTVIRRRCDSCAG